MSLLELNEVSQTYRGGSPLHPRVVRAVRGVSIEVKQGECLAIVGESGSGKSTLLRMIAGLEAPASGSIRFQGRPVTPRAMRGDRRRAIQMVYQNSFEATNPRFTARQVVSEPLQYFRLAPKSEQRHTVEALLRQVGIPEVEADKKVYEFSGGQLQRICIARALAAQPEVLLLDEPLSSLDVSVQAQILNLLRDLQEALGLTYVLISHDLEMVYNLASAIPIRSCCSRRSLRRRNPRRRRNRRGRADASMPTAARTPATAAEPRRPRCASFRPATARPAISLPHEATGSHPRGDLEAALAVRAAAARVQLHSAAV